MRMQSAARTKRGGMRGGCPVASTRIHVLRPTRSHRFHLHHVKQRSLLRSRSAFLSAGSLLPLRLGPSAPNEGRRSAGGGSLGRASHLRGATLILPGDGRAPLGAPRGDFRLRDRRFVFRQCPPESAPRLGPRPGITSRPLGPAPPTAAVRSAARDATPRSALRASPETPLVSEDDHLVPYLLKVVNYKMS
jgi:hypothetical protein